MFGPLPALWGSLTGEALVFLQLTWSPCMKEQDSGVELQNHLKLPDGKCGTEEAEALCLALQGHNNIRCMSVC